MKANDPASNTRLNPTFPGQKTSKPLLAAVFTLVLGAVSNAAIALEDLAELQWKNRIVLLDARGEDTSFMSDLQAADYEIVDRDILWFILDQGGITTNYTGVVSPEFADKIRDEYFDGKAKVVLVGKDGGVKYRQTTLELPDIFVRIDAMPMRQQEMLQKAD